MLCELTRFHFYCALSQEPTYYLVSDLQAQDWKGPIEKIKKSDDNSVEACLKCGSCGSSIGVQASNRGMLMVVRGALREKIGTGEKRDKLMQITGSGTSKPQLRVKAIKFVNTISNESKDFANCRDAHVYFSKWMAVGKKSYLILYSFCLHFFRN